MVHIRESASLGRLARDARRARGMSQADLARAIGVSRQWVVKFESQPDSAHLGLALAALMELGLVIDVTSGDDAASSADDILQQVFRG